MSISVQAVQGVNAQTQTQPVAQPPKSPARAATPQDKVTISQEARKALKHRTRQAGGGGANDYGDKQY